MNPPLHRSNAAGQDREHGDKSITPAGISRRRRRVIESDGEKQDVAPISRKRRRVIIDPEDDILEERCRGPQSKQAHKRKWQHKKKKPQQQQPPPTQVSPYLLVKLLLTNND